MPSHHHHHHQHHHQHHQQDHPSLVIDAEQSHTHTHTININSTAVQRASFSINQRCLFIHPAGGFQHLFFLLSTSFPSPPPLPPLPPPLSIIIFTKSGERLAQADWCDWLPHTVRYHLQQHQQCCLSLSLFIAHSTRIFVVTSGKKVKHKAREKSGEGT